jgi:hypothetical protein
VAVTTKKSEEVESESSSEEHEDICPYWHQVASDFVSVYPAGGYCIAGCHKKVKVMAGKTLREVCAMNYNECEGYRRVLAEEETRERKTPETLRK